MCQSHNPNHRFSQFYHFFACIFIFSVLTFFECQSFAMGRPLKEAERTMATNFVFFFK